MVSMLLQFRYICMDFKIATSDVCVYVTYERKTKIWSIDIFLDANSFGMMMSVSFYSY